MANQKDLLKPGNADDALQRPGKVRKEVKPDHQEDPATPASSSQYIDCHEAAKRLKATLGEMAAWVFMGTKADALNRLSYRKTLKQTRLQSQNDLKEREELARMGPKDCGLAAYLNVNELDPPRRFNYDRTKHFDYLTPLNNCWFRKDDIAAFEPTERYITGETLIKLWSKRMDQAKAYILARIEESRLTPSHPVFGGTQGTLSDLNEKNLPPLESGLFMLSQVKKIEAEDFGTDRDGTSDTSHATIKGEKECQKWLRDLMRKGPPSKSKSQYEVAAIAQFKISSRGFVRAWANAVAETENLAWSLPGRKSSRRIDTPK